MGVKSLKQVKNISDVKIVPGDPAALLEGTFDNATVTNSGFCWQKNKKIIGCKDGTRYQNSVKIKKRMKHTEENTTEGEDKELVNTVKVIWIMKCW